MGAKIKLTDAELVVVLEQAAANSQGRRGQERGSQRSPGGEDLAERRSGAGGTAAEGKRSSDTAPPNV